MIKFHPQYVIDGRRHRKAVLLPAGEWDKLLEELEVLDDIRAYDKAKAGSQDSVPFESAVRAYHCPKGA